MSMVSVSRLAGAPQLGHRVFDPLVHRRQRALALGGVVLDLGELDRELVVGDRDQPAVAAVDDRDRAAPVALAREQPVAEAVVDGGLAQASLGERRDDRPLRLGRAHPVVLAGVDQALVVGVGDEGGVGFGPLAGDHLADRQPERGGEVEVALVVGGNGHQRAGAVLHQHVVGDEHRDLLAVDRIGDRAAERDAGLRPALVAALLGGLADRRVDVRADLVLVAAAGGEPLEVGVLGREHEEGGAEEGVGAGREDREVDPELLVAEGDLGALGAADPVALHRHHVLGPATRAGRSRRAAGRRSR